MMKLSERETPDLIVIWIAFLVGFVVISSVVGMIAWKLIDTTADLSSVALRIATLTNTLIGVIVGYLAGRGVIPAPNGVHVVADDATQLDDESEMP